VGAADELRANSKLKSSEYGVPVLGLIFLRYADHKFAQAQARIASKGPGGEPSQSGLSGAGVLYLPDNARFSTLLQLPGRSRHRQGHQRGDEGN